jgi:murein DD-endopeptidase MepM/ murein hydrolase activator NlpD
MPKKLSTALVFLLLIAGGGISAGAASVSMTLAALFGSAAASGCLPTDSAATGDSPASPSPVTPDPSTSSSAELTGQPGFAPMPQPVPVDAVPAGGVSDSLTLQTTNGDTLILGANQLQNARQIVATARSINIPDPGLTVMMITVLQESKLQMYANDSVPGSLDYPHDVVGSDLDSVGLFQQRPGWGTVQERMDVTYSTEAFFGGPTGPNGGTPAGLLDIEGWETMAPGAAAQAVQVSAFPDAYDQWIPAAQQLLQSLGVADGFGNCLTGIVSGTVSGTVVMPLTTPFVMTSDFGPRSSPTAGASSWHPAVDLQNLPNPCGQSVFAMMEGTVTESSRLYLSIQHPDGFVISYLHTSKGKRIVDVGDVVTPGQLIALVGNEAPSTGCHLDVRVNIEDNTNPQIAALPRDAVNAPGWVNPEDFFALYGLTLCPAEWCKRY